MTSQQPAKGRKREGAMPKERIYDDTQQIEVQWARDGQLVCVMVEENVETHTIDKDGNVTNVREETVMAMWQTINADELDRLITALQRARRHAFN